MVLTCGAAASSWVPTSIEESFTAFLLSIEKGLRRWNNRPALNSRAIHYREKRTERC
jgi:hypothetical protein